MIDLTTPEARELGFPQAQGFNKLIRKNTFSDGETDLHSLYKTAEQYCWANPSHSVAVVWLETVVPTRMGIGYGAFSEVYECLYSAAKYFELSKAMETPQGIAKTRFYIPSRGENLSDANRLAHMLLDIGSNPGTKDIAVTSAVARAKKNIAEAYALYSGTHPGYHRPARPRAHPGAWRVPEFEVSQPA